MNKVFWTLQIILRIKFISVSFSHGLGHNKEEMKQGIAKMGLVAKPLLSIIALCSLLAVLDCYCLGLWIP